MNKLLVIILSFAVFCGCGTTQNNASSSPDEKKFEEDKSYCEAYAEFPVVTHPIYIKCMKDRGWDLPE